MDIHRCRFVPYPACAINAVAFSHPSTKLQKRPPSTLRLAIGRSNGDIEVWNPRGGSWEQETILKGGKDRSIEGLAWTHDLEDGEDGGGEPTSAGKLRLFSIGYSTVVTEWDLALGRPVRHSGGNFGEIWCLAAQPRWRRPEDPAGRAAQGEREDQLLAVGCGDGTLVLLSTADGELKYLRTLPPPSGRKPRVLSLAFQSRQRLVAGYSNGTMRIFDVRGRGQTVTMSLGSGPKTGPAEILVWCLKCLDDGTIVSGDSTGEVKFWDASTASIFQRIKSHNADVLDITSSADGMSVLSGGMDRRTVLYKLFTTGKKKGRWGEISHRRYHQNDVKTMASFEAQNMSVTASGGLDTIPIIVPLDRLGQENSRALANLPNCPPLDSAPSKRLLMSWWEREISIWRVGGLTVKSLEEDEILDAPQSRALVAKIALQGDESITSACIAANGELVAAATIAGVKVFGLRPRTSAPGLKVQKVACPAALADHGVRILRLSPDSRWLMAVRMDSTVYMHRLVQDADNTPNLRILGTSIRLERPDRKARKVRNYEGTHGRYLRNITRVAWSSDSKIAVACDITGDIYSWVLEGHEDPTLGVGKANDAKEASSSDGSGDSDSDSSSTGFSATIIYGQQWLSTEFRIPRLPASPVVLSFRPADSDAALPSTAAAVHPTRHTPHPHSHDLPQGEDRLLVITSEHQLFEYHVLTGQLSSWSRRNPPAYLPAEFKELRERVISVIWDVKGGRERVWLYGSSWLWMFDLARDFGGEGEKKTTQSEAVVSQNGASQQLSLTGRGKNKKRKRDQPPPDEAIADRRALTKHTSGAGGKVPLDRRNDGIGAGMLTTEGKKQKWTSFERQHKDLPSERSDGDDDDQGQDGDDRDGKAAGEGSELVRLRRAEEDAAMSGDGANGAGEAGGEARGPPYWRTYKYRPILGVVALGGVEGLEDGAEERRNVEVALVERPAWDVEMPARWEGNQEWRK